MGLLKTGRGVIVMLVGGVFSKLLKIMQVWKLLFRVFRPSDVTKDWTLKNKEVDLTPKDKDKDMKMVLKDKD